MSEAGQILDQYENRMFFRADVERAVQKHIVSLRDPEKRNRFLQAALASRSRFDAGHKMHQRIATLFLDNVADLAARNLLQNDLFESSKDAYYNNTKFMQFSHTVQQKLFAGFRNFSKINTHGWSPEAGNLNQKMTYARDLTASFVKTYDPENYLGMQDNSRFLLRIKNFEPDDPAGEKNIITVASFKNNGSHNMIHVDGYVMDEDRCAQANDAPAFKNRIKALNDTVCSSLITGYGLKQSAEPGCSIILENDRHAQGKLYVPMFESEAFATEIMGHELIHQALQNLEHFYQKDRMTARARFGYTKKDHALYVAGQAFYVQPKDNNELYKSNSEEIFTNKAQLYVASNHNKRPKLSVWYGYTPSQLN